MMKSRFICFCVFCITFLNSIFSQDEVPRKADVISTSRVVRQVPNHNMILDVAAFDVPFPSVFKGVGQNHIVDRSKSLDPFMEKLRLARAGFLTDSVKVLHVGDSHVKGHYFSYKVRDLIQEEFPLVSYEDYGINGAVEKTFNTPDRVRQIANFYPDLLILSFGTNTCNDRNYKSNYHYRELESLILQIRQVLPSVPILLTTPPGAYERLARRRYRENRRTELGAKVIRECAADHNLAYWDLFNLVGGTRYAPTNWMNSNLMRPDHIHFYVEGYEFQGKLLYKALIQRYNEYVTPRN